ncbi:MAG: GerAB/ArcD/ProY family transporter [Clostridia bacterium]|nr:GerAB/ArcD/ProY family transporter [Clostridia bacterium]
MTSKSILKHGIYKNLAADTVFNSQVATLIFLAGIAFKLSALPSMLSETFGSSAFWVFVCYTTIDLVLSGACLCFAKANCDALLVATGSTAYRTLSFVAMLWLTLKGIFHFSYAASYLTHELFEGLEPSLIYILFMLPIAYLGAKGIRTTARTSEVFFLAVLLVTVLNVVFLKTKTDFARVLPVFSKEPSEIARDFAKYGFALGDMFPLVFVHIKNKKLPYAPIGLVGTWIVANLIMLLGVAIYGNALKSVSDLFIHISGFNQFSKDVGRMEWTNLFAMLISYIISLAFTYFGAVAASERAFHSGLPAKILFPLSILACILFVPSAQSMTKFATGDFGYVMFALPLLLVLILLFVYAYAMRNHPSISKLLDEEYDDERQHPTVIPSDKRGLLQPAPQEKQ